MIDLANQATGVYGARMTGGGFGGCTVNLVQASRVGSFKETVVKGYAHATGVNLKSTFARRRRERNVWGNLECTGRAKRRCALDRNEQTEQDQKEQVVIQSSVVAIALQNGPARPFTSPLQPADAGVGPGVATAHRAPVAGQVEEDEGAGIFRNMIRIATCARAMNAPAVRVIRPTRKLSCSTTTLLHCDGRRRRKSTRKVY